MKERYDSKPLFRNATVVLSLIITLSAAYPVAAQKGIIIHSHILSPDIPTFSGDVGMSSRPVARFNVDNYASNELTLLEHLGTHLDAPYHFGGVGKRTVDQIPPEDMIMPAVIIDVRGEVKADDDYQLTVDDINRWEKTYGTIPERAIVVMFTGWQDKWEDPKEYRNEIDGKLHFPGFSVNTARWLMENRNVLALGIDTLSADYGPSEDFPVHKVINGANRYIVENLTNLDKIPPRGKTFHIAPILIAGGTGAPSLILSFTD
jgi:kynurenine formamidase